MGLKTPNENPSTLADAHGASSRTDRIIKYSKSKSAEYYRCKLQISNTQSIEDLIEEVEREKKKGIENKIDVAYCQLK